MGFFGYQSDRRLGLHALSVAATGKGWPYLIHRFVEYVLIATQYQTSTRILLRQSILANYAAPAVRYSFNSFAAYVLL